MTLRRKRFVTVAVVSIVAVSAAAYFWLTREVVYLAATSTSKEIVATVSWNATVFGMVDSHLVVKDFYGSTLYRVDLLKARDHFVDIQSEIQGLEINDDAIVLRVKRSHYKGPDRFELSRLRQR